MIGGTRWKSLTRLDLTLIPASGRAGERIKFYAPRTDESIPIFHRVTAGSEHPIRKMFYNCRSLDTLTFNAPLRMSLSAPPFSDCDCARALCICPAHPHEFEVALRRQTCLAFHYLNTIHDAFTPLQFRLRTLEMSEAAAVCPETISLISLLSGGLKSLNVSSVRCITRQCFSIWNLWMAIEKCASLEKLTVGFNNSKSTSFLARPIENVFFELAQQICNLSIPACFNPDDVMSAQAVSSITALAALSDLTVLKPEGMMMRSYIKKFVLAPKKLEV